MSTDLGLNVCRVCECCGHIERQDFAGWAVDPEENIDYCPTCLRAVLDAWLGFLTSGRYPLRGRNES